ncbi:unnamed protein product [Chrysoparadoxa australica]
MGNSGGKGPPIPPPVGDRIKKCEKMFLLTKEDIEKFWKIFKRFDPKHEGVLHTDVFFNRVVYEERSPIGMAMFQLIDVDDEEKLEFGEFVQAVCTFCCLSSTEMLKFAFMVYDKDKSGVLEMEELQHFIKQLHSSNVSNNIQDALGSLSLDEYGRLTFDGFKLMNSNFPQVLYPVFRLQQSTQRYIMGSRWWKKKVTYLEYWRKHRKDVERKEQEKIRKQRQQQRDKQIRKAMGVKEYYLNRQKRQIYIDAMADVFNDDAAPPVAEADADADADAAATVQPEEPAASLNQDADVAAPVAAPEAAEPVPAAGG